MTSVDCPQSGAASGSLEEAAGQAAHAFPLHRLRRVRCREGLSRCIVARRLGLSEDDVKCQELETADIPLSALYKWQEVLGVPLTELLEEPKQSLSPPLMKRAQMLRVMKTAKYILEQTGQKCVKRMAQRLVKQLIEIMPELRKVSPWQLIGRRRRRREYGRAAEYSLPDEMFIDPGQ